MSRVDALDAAYYAALLADVDRRTRVLWLGEAPTAGDLVGIDVVPGRAARRPSPDERAVDAGSSEALPAGPTGPYDLAVVNLLDDVELAQVLPRLRCALSDVGCVLVGCAHADSTGRALAILDAASSPSSGLPSAATPRAILATLAAAGYVAEHIRIVPSSSGTTAGSLASTIDDALAGALDGDIERFIVMARPAPPEIARRLTRERLHRFGERSRLPATDLATEDALLRREQQIGALEASLGWRLLSYYGPYKRRFVVPAWRALQRAIRGFTAGNDAPSPYEEWCRFSDRFHELPTSTHDGGERSPETPSIVLPVGAGSETLQAVLASLLAQHHGAWQLCLAPVGDAGAAAIRGVAERLPAGETRVSIAAVQPTRAAAINAALAGARGDLVLMLAPGVVLARDALSELIAAAAVTGADVAYADEDERDAQGRGRAARLLPGWSPDLLLARPYWPGVVLYRRGLLDEVGPLPDGYDGAELYDLALRATERRARIVHVPRILSHARVGESAAPAPAAQEPGRRALTAALARRGIAGTVHWCPEGEVYRVQRALAEAGKVTIIVPTRDGGTMLERCLRTLEQTDHPRFEVVIVDNGSSERATLALLAATTHTVIRAPAPFNFSRLNNLAVARTSGEYLVFLNDDTEPRSPDWLRALEEHAQRPEVGAVGARLLYPNGRIQHAGIALGIGGIAGHPYRYAREGPAGVRNVSAVTAACLMMRREAFDAVGGFDERLPVNSNDVDLCLRLRDRGYLIVYTPHATLTHHESATRGLRATPDDAWLMTRRWRATLAADPYYNPNADHAEESGGLDLSKPDGLVCRWAGPARATGSVELGSERIVGQCFLMPDGELAAIVVQLTAPGGVAADAIRLRIRDAPDATADLRTSLRAIPGRSDDEHWFCFEPIAAAGGRRCYFFLETTEGVTAHLRRTTTVSDVMGPCFENHAPTHGTLAFRLYARAPYRCGTSPP